MADVSLWTNDAERDDTHCKVYISLFKQSKRTLYGRNTENIYIPYSVGEYLIKVRSLHNIHATRFIAGAF